MASDKDPNPDLAPALSQWCPLCPSEFKKTLEEAIRSDTSGHFQRLLISLAQVGPRGSGPGAKGATWGQAEQSPTG